MDYPPNGFSTTLSSGLTDSGLTISLNSITGLASEGVGVIFKKDADGDVVDTSVEFVHWTSTGTGTVICSDAGDRGIAGSYGSAAQAHDSGDYFEVWVSSQYYTSQRNGFIAEHSAAGVHDTTKVADLTTEQTLTNKTLTSPTVTSPTITGTALVTADGLNVSSLSRQSILNSNFDVWQRGTSVALTAANGYTADRWYVETATAGTDKTISRQDGTGVNGSYYCARVAIVQDVDELLTFSQALESQDSIKFRGKKLTLSFYARGGAEFVADNSTLVSKIVTGKGTDQKVLAFTTSADGVSQNNTLTTDWQKFTCTTTAAIAADITQLGVSFSFTHAGSGTTTNYFEITQVQLCAGDVALPFQPKSFEEELRACQRYCRGYTSTTSNDIVTHGIAVSATLAYIYFFFDTPMRTAPTMTATAGDWKIGFPSGALQDVTSLAGGSGFDSDRAFMAEVGTASGLTTGYPQVLVNDGGGTRRLILDAEL